MQEKRRVFLLNDEQKILVFFHLVKSEEYIPKIIIPNFDMLIFDSPQVLNLEDMEFITEINQIKNHFETINNHLMKVNYIKKNIYYAMKIELTQKIQMSIMNFCEREHFVPYFMTIQEIHNALTYIKENYENIRPQKDLEEAINVLSRKLNYEEY